MGFNRKEILKLSCMIKATGGLPPVSLTRGISVCMSAALKIIVYSDYVCL